MRSHFSPASIFVSDFVQFESRVAASRRDGGFVERRFQRGYALADKDACGARFGTVQRADVGDFKLGIRGVREVGKRAVRPENYAKLDGVELSEFYSRPCFGIRRGVETL